MAINFPDSPVDGQEAILANNTWMYSTSKSAWLRLSRGVSVDSIVDVYANISELPLSGVSAGQQAFVESSNSLYISNGSGWYSITLVNTDPSITSVQDASAGTTPFTLATDGTATVITVTASDPEDVPLTYSYSVTSGSLTNGGGTTATVVQGTGANTNKFTITPSTTEAYAGTFELTFTASDGVNQGTSANNFTLEFIIDWTTTTQQQKLMISDAAANDFLGAGTGAISIDGDYIVIGCYVKEAAYIFTRSGSTWTQQQKLTASDGQSGDDFGKSVHISGTSVIVGSAKNQSNGAAYIFTRSGSTWTQQQKLTSTLTGSARQLGKWAALEGDNIVMGSGKDKIVIYSRSGSTWTQDLITEGDDTAYNDRFSFSVDISGRSIISSAEYEDEAASNAGAVYVFIAS